MCLFQFNWRNIWRNGIHSNVKIKFDLINKFKQNNFLNDTEKTLKYYKDCLTFGRVWRGSSTLGELIVASPARRRQWPGHPRLSHLSSSYRLPHATPVAGFGIGRIGDAPTTMTNDFAQARPTVRLVPTGTKFPHSPFCNRKIESFQWRLCNENNNAACIKSFSE